MARERDGGAPDARAEFVRWTRIGQAVAGYIAAYRENDKGGLIELSPVVSRVGRGQDFQVYGSLAVGISADLARKITPVDVGRVVLIEFKDVEPTTRENPRRIFRVLELEEADAAKIGLTPAAIREAQKAAQVSRSSSSAATAERPATGFPGAEDEDDLPF